jgi:secreted PhoX family phosphatase
MSSKYPAGSLGRPYIIATAPVGAEFTGPYLSPDQKTLFLSVQHPGEKSAAEGKWRSTWPRVTPAANAKIDWDCDWKLAEIPRPGIVTIDISKLPEILLTES